jgi:hypothetical protein
VERQDTSFLTYMGSNEFCMFRCWLLDALITKKKKTYIIFLGNVKHIIINKHVITKHIKLIFHVLKEATNKSSQMNDMSRLVFFKDSLGIFSLSVKINNIPVSQRGLPAGGGTSDNQHKTNIPPRRDVSRMQISNEDNCCDCSSKPAVSVNASLLA